MGEGSIFPGDRRRVMMEAGVGERSKDARPGTSSDSLRGHGEEVSVMETAARGGAGRPFIL